MDNIINFLDFNTNNNIILIVLRRVLIMRLFFHKTSNMSTGQLFEIQDTWLPYIITRPKNRGDLISKYGV